MVMKLHYSTLLNSTSHKENYMRSLSTIFGIALIPLTLSFSAYANQSEALMLSNGRIQYSVAEEVVESVQGSRFVYASCAEKNMEAVSGGCSTRGVIKSDLGSKKTYAAPTAVLQSSSWTYNSLTGLEGWSCGFKELKAGEQIIAKVTCK
jgi:hypothetical protein